jgi:hypothetical protein
LDLLLLERRLLDVFRQWRGRLNTLLTDRLFKSGRSLQIFGGSCGKPSGKHGGSDVAGEPQASHGSPAQAL